MTTGKIALAEVEAELGWETDKAFGLDVGRHDRRGQKILIFVPKALVEDNGDGSYTMPEWLAKDKGLI